MWWHTKLCAKVLKRFFVAFARLAAMCKGFKGNVQFLPLCARVLWKRDAVCGDVQRLQGNDVDLAATSKVFKEMWWRANVYARVLRKLFVASARLVAMCKGFNEMFISYQYVQGFYGSMAPCVAMCKSFKDAM